MFLVDPKFTELVDFGAANGCWEWRGGLNQGYGQVSRGGTAWKVHRLAFEWSYERRIPRGRVIMHLCDNTICVNLNHLREGSHRENRLDSVAKNRIWRPVGEKNPNAKLSQSDVDQIRQLRADGKRIVEIADRFHISHPMVSYICNGKNWR